MNKCEEMRMISGVNPLKCMKCGKCSASCPSYNEMDIKPHQFVSYVVSGDIEALLASKSAEKCLSCFACIERCPEVWSRASFWMPRGRWWCVSAVSLC